MCFCSGQPMHFCTGVDTVGRWVLRSEIDSEGAQRCLAHGGPLFGARARQ